MTGLLQRLEDEKRESERQAMTSEHTLRQLECEMTRVRERSRRTKTNCAASGRSVPSARSSSPRSSASCSSSKSGIDAGSRVAEAQGNLESLRQRRDEAAQLASEVRANVATLEERRRGAMLTVQRIESMLSEVSAHLAKLQAQLESAAAEKQQRENENVHLAEQVVDLDG